MGPCSIASFSTASPPTRLMAPATPAPIRSSVLAALAIASTSSSVMSPEAISSLVLPTDVFMVLQGTSGHGARVTAVSYTHLRAHETRHDLVCRLLLEKKKKATLEALSC